MKMKILFATTNKGKYDEVVDFFAEEGIELIFNPDLPDVEENKPTLKLNAITKAKYGAKYSKMFTIAEDSGFFVRALDYFPGIHANRWMEGTWKEKRKAILDMMEGQTDRTAYLINNFALVSPDGELLLTTKVKNIYSITHQEYTSGDPTFGYNEILNMNGYNIGDLTREKRNFIKNRGRFAKEIKEVLNEYRT
jgi:XTP/dITP diphosphohydrolase